MAVPVTEVVNAGVFPLGGDCIITGDAVTPKSCNISFSAIAVASAKGGKDDSLKSEAVASWSCCATKFDDDGKLALSTIISL